MLTAEKVQENKQRYLSLLSKIEGLDVEKFTKYLDNPRVDFFNKPLNVYQENAYAGSLCEHCLQIYDEISKLCNLYAPGIYSESKLLLVALMKDIYRAELYEPYLKNQKNDETGQWESIIAFKTRDQRPVFGDIGFSSYMIAKKFISDIDDETVETICFSPISFVNNIDSFSIRKTYLLVTLTTMAELASTYISNNK